MYIDRIDLVLPENDLASVLSALTSASGTLEPLPSVSTADRKRYAKLGLKNEALALQIIEVGRANPDLIPRGIDFAKIDRDLVARDQLRTLKLLLEALLGRVNDSMLLTGVDLYAAALSIYHCLRRNADTTSLKETVDELKKGFARPSRKKKQQQETTPAHSAVPEPLEKSAQPERRVTEVAPETITPGTSRSMPSVSERSILLPTVSLKPRWLGAQPSIHISFDQLPPLLPGGFTLVSGVGQPRPSGFSFLDSTGKCDDQRS